MDKRRINQPVTSTLSPPALEAIEILKEELDKKQTSHVIDYALREAVKALGYKLKNESND